MEQYSHYLMPVKSKNMMINRCSHSWEERAFAEDAYGPLGGFVWPPRSYSCSFCGRIFRSAQALGGHMNVHRRERAKLKQSSDHPDITAAATAAAAPPQQNEVLISQVTFLDHKNPSNISLSSSRVPPVPGLGQETFCSTHSDTKSSVSDDIARDGENSVVYFKKPKTTCAGMPGIMCSMEEIDLELRL